MQNKEAWAGESEVMIHLLLLFEQIFPCVQNLWHVTVFSQNVFYLHQTVYIEVILSVEP